MPTLIIMSELKKEIKRNGPLLVPGFRRVQSQHDPKWGHVRRGGRGEGKPEEAWKEKSRPKKTGIAN